MTEVVFYLGVTIVTPYSLGSEETDKKFVRNVEADTAIQVVLGDL